MLRAGLSRPQAARIRRSGARPPIWGLPGPVQGLPASLMRGCSQPGGGPEVCLGPGLGWWPVVALGSQLQSVAAWPGLWAEQKEQSQLGGCMGPEARTRGEGTGGRTAVCAWFLISPGCAIQKVLASP